MKALRRIPGCGMANLRDLGGYPARDGGATRFGVFYRADAVRGLTREIAEAIRALGITTAVDLRNPNEGHNPLLDVGGIEVRNIPMTDFEKFDFAPKTDSLTDLYLQTLEHAGDEIAAILRALYNAKGAALFHCSAGKDRTGMTAALLLSLCGVGREDIIADYEVSNTYIQPVLRGLAAKGYQIDPHMLLSAPPQMEAFLGEIDARGGIRRYLADCGVSDAEMDGLRDRLVNGS